MSEKIYVVECYYFYEGSWIEYISPSMDNAFNYYNKRLRSLENSEGMNLSEYPINENCDMKGEMIFGVEKEDGKLKRFKKRWSE